MDGKYQLTGPTSPPHHSLEQFQAFLTHFLIQASEEP